MPNLMEQIDERNEAHDDEQGMTKQALASPQLAWDSAQRRFVVPKQARWWRVSRKNPRGGRPKPINTSRGPLHIRIDADFDGLAEAVHRLPGWYVLNATDENFAIISNLPAAHIEVVPEMQSDGLDGYDVATEPMDSAAVAIQRLTDALQQALVASAQREQSMLAAFTEMASNVYAGFAQVQQSTAAMITAVQGGYEIASEVSLQKQPPTPDPPPAPAPQKNFVEFLCSPAGNTAIAALGGVLKAAVEDK